MTPAMMLPKMVGQINKMIQQNAERGQ